VVQRLEVRILVAGSLVLAMLLGAVDAATAEGTIVAWGWNYWAQRDVPAPNSDFVALSAQNMTSAALRSSGAAAVWGMCLQGQCAIPAPNGGFVAVSEGGGHTLGLKANGSIVAWGDNT
jgi:hypothetical protein